MAGLWAAKERLAVRLVGVVAAPSGDEASLEGRNRARMEGAQAVKGALAAERSTFLIRGSGTHAFS